MSAKFRVGQRVRPSQYGIERCIFPKTRHGQSGVIVKVGAFNHPAVLWEGRKTPRSYHPDFIAPDCRNFSKLGGG